MAHTLIKLTYTIELNEDGDGYYLWSRYIDKEGSYQRHFVFSHPNREYLEKMVERLTHKERS